MKVSILIPAYNVGQYISQCLESVCAQTHADLQIVVIDDGSKDDTFSVASAFAEKDDRIEVISRENKGVAQTRNELLDKATGDYVLFVDSDDWIEPDMVSTLVETAMANAVDLVMCRMFTPETRKANPSDVKIWEKRSILEKFLEHRELTGSLWNKLIKRTLFSGIRFNPKVSYGEDAMVVWDVINRIDKMASIPTGLYHYRMNASSISHQGLSASKMSAIPVWDYICSKVPEKDNKLQLLANSRAGAECTLLLYAAAKSKLKENDNIRALRRHVRNKLPYMIKSHVLSYSFLAFATVLAINWRLAYIVSYIDK